MRKRLLLIITVGVCFSPSLYAMNPPSCGTVGPCPPSSAYDAPGAAGCEVGNAFVAKTQEEIQKYSKYQSSNNGSNTATSATEN